MKYIFLISLLSIVWCTSVLAQNRSIRFETMKEWQEILRQAKTEKKLVFVDCYASWCVPCKELNDQVFTRDEVADYFNRTFMNSRFDIEKDTIGRFLVSKYKVSSLPTLLFIDPDTENEVHRVVGSGNAKWLIEQAHTALDPKNSLSGMAKRYQAGERDIPFVRHYIDMLSEASMAETAKEITNHYLETIPDQLFLDEEIWSFIVETMQSPFDVAFRRIMKHREACYQHWEKERVNGLLDKVLNYEVFQVFNWKMMYKKPFDELRNEKLMAYLSTLSYPAVPQTLLKLKTAKYAREDNFQGVLTCMKDAFQYNVFIDGRGPEYFLESMELFKTCQDSVIKAEVLVWLDKESQASDNYFYKSNISHVKSLLYRSWNLKEEAAKADKEKYTFFDEGSRQCGGRVLRMVKPE